MAEDEESLDEVMEALKVYFDKTNPTRKLDRMGDESFYLERCMCRNPLCTLQDPENKIIGTGGANDSTTFAMDFIRNAPKYLVD